MRGLGKALRKRLIQAQVFSCLHYLDPSFFVQSEMAFIKSFEVFNFFLPLFSFSENGSNQSSFSLCREREFGIEKYKNNSNTFLKRTGIYWNMYSFLPGGVQVSNIYQMERCIYLFPHLTLR